MELTLPPGRHETVEKQDPVHGWRVARLARLGIPWPVAEVAAVMGTSQNTVKSQLRTGLVRLRESLDTSVVSATHAESTNG